MNQIRVTRRYIRETTYTNQILTLDASDLSTQVYRCSHHCNWVPRSFNFADLQGPVPASVYFASGDGALFNGHLHKTIVDGNYYPILSLPRAITNIAPDMFASCTVRYNSKPINVTYNGEDKNPSTTIFQSSHPGIWDPPVKLQPILGTLAAPSLPAFTDESPPYIPAPIVGEQHRSLHTPVSTWTSPQPTTVFGEIAVAEDGNSAGLSHQPALETKPVILRSTFSALPSTLVAQLGSRTVVAGGLPFTLDNTVISRAMNGDYIIESTQVENSLSKASGSQNPTRPNEGVNSDEERGRHSAARYSSGQMRTIGHNSRGRWICALSLFAAPFLL
jgi:hypothetical protein